MIDDCLGGLVSAITGVRVVVVDRRGLKRAAVSFQIDNLVDL